MSGTRRYATSSRNRPIAAVDFVIQDRAVHGVNGMVNLYGIESPGLTSSLAIGAYVRSLLDKDAA